MLRDAREDGRLRGRRLPRPRPRPDRLRRRRSWTSPPSTAAPSTCTPTATTRPGSPGSPRWPAGCAPASPSARAAAWPGCPPEAAARAADQLAAAGVTVVCLPQGGCGGRRSAAAARAPVRLLRAAGRTGRGGQRRAAGRGEPGGPRRPAGGGVPAGLRTALRPEDAYDAVSAAARAALGLPEVRVEAGFPAELLAVRGDRLAGALSLAYSRIVDPPGAGGGAHQRGAGVLRLAPSRRPWTCRGRGDRELRSRRAGG